SNPKTRNIDLIPAIDIVRVINNEDKKVAKAVEKALPEIAAAVEVITDSFLKGGRLAYFGAGTSGRLGVLDASECWPTFSAPDGMITGFIAGGDYALKHSIEGAEDDKNEAMKHLKEFKPTKKDVVIGISASGNPNYVLTVLANAQKKGARTIGITSNPEAKLKQYADITILTRVGPEAVTGSSRMKSGTAQKMVLNMLSTASMVKIGKTYGNYMIDLQLTCNKLVDRGNRIISTICKIPLAKAEEYRIKANNNIKTACVMYKKQCSKTVAEKLLKKHNGILRKVLLDEKI
ncbi:MAG: N-acetylmuramic acid 6-phosphate etherase, partial [Alphaproteobacteria bacterium]|nr:N-acetylmuramic acid 6-phosphate etherase [Alphaproteobacteria bacterium]